MEQGQPQGATGHSLWLPDPANAGDAQEVDRVSGSALFAVGRGARNVPSVVRADAPGRGPWHPDWRLCAAIQTVAHV